MQLQDVAPAAASLAPKAGTATAAFGMWAWIGDNSDQIVALATVMGAGVSVLAFLIGHYPKFREWRKRRNG